MAEKEEQAAIAEVSLSILSPQLVRLVQDCLDVEAYEHALEALEHTQACAVVPPIALLRQLFALSLCSLPPSASGPSIQAIVKATNLLSQLSRNWLSSTTSDIVQANNAAVARHVLQALPHHGKRKRDDVDVDPALFNQIETWVHTRMLTASDVWDLLSGGRTSLSARDRRSPLVLDEFWLDQRTLKQIEKEYADAKAAYGVENPPLTLSEGSWRTLRAIVELWEAENAASLAVQFVPSSENAALLNSPWRHKASKGALRAGSGSSEVGKALDVAMSFPFVLSLAPATTTEATTKRLAVSERAHTAARLLALLYRLTRTKVLDHDAIIRGTANRLLELELEHRTMLCTRLEAIQPDLVVQILQATFSRPKRGTHEQLLAVEYNGSTFSINPGITASSPDTAALMVPALLQAGADSQAARIVSYLPEDHPLRRALASTVSLGSEFESESNSDADALT